MEAGVPERMNAPITRQCVNLLVPHVHERDTVTRVHACLELAKYSPFFGVNQINPTQV